MGSTLICFLMSEQTAGLLCWLQPVLPRTSMGGLGGFASAAFPVPWDFWVQYKVSAEYLKTACQRKKHNSSNIIAPLNEGYLWRDSYFYPCLSSAYCICISANKALAFFFFFIFFPRTDFCLETSAILFSLVETVHAILKDQLKYNFQKISAS